MGPARGAALPGRRRPARRLARRPPRPRLRGAGRRPPLVGAQPRDQDVPRPQPRALPLARRRARRRGRAGCSSSPGAEPDDLPLVLVPDGEPLRRPDHASSSPTRSGCAPGPSSRSTTCASSAAVRPGSRPRSTPRPRGCGPSSSSATRPAARPARAPSIENYLGFPKGLSGADLTHRAVAQAPRFGAEMVLARDVVGFETRGPVRAVLLRRRRRDRGPGRARRHRRLLPAARGARARRARRAAASTTAPRQRGRASARARTSTSSARPTPPARRRSTSPATPSGSSCSSAAPRSRTSMSQYLVERIRAADNIEVRLRTEVVAARGDGHLEALTLADRDTGAEEEVATNWLFVFIGAVAAHRLARRRRRPRRPRASSSPAPTCWLPTTPARWPLDRAAVRPRDERARGVRRRRRAARLDEAGRLRRRRGRDVGLPRPPLPGDASDGRRRAARRSSLFDGLDRRPARRARSRPARRSPFDAGERALRRGPARPTSGGCCSRARSSLVRQRRHRGDGARRR